MNNLGILSRCVEYMFARTFLKSSWDWGYSRSLLQVKLHDGWKNFQMNLSLSGGVNWSFLGEIISPVEDGES